MEEICKKEDCYGCYACLNICPKNAISMEHSLEGFLYPNIDNSICINCGLCKKVCPVIEFKAFSKPIDVYSGWSTNEEVRLNSSSGGAFTELSRIILDKSGIVFGCTFDNNTLTAKHIFIDDIKDIYKLQGSKYIQSNIGHTYKKVKDFLTNGIYVLFSGTPCQIAGLKKYLGKNYDNLFTVDLVCHGVPSPLIFKDYIDFIKKKYNFQKINDVKFRKKDFSWIYYNMEINGDSSSGKLKYVGTYYRDPYLRGFSRDLFLRNSCHTCKFANFNRVSDVTIADWWNYKKKCKKDIGFQYKGVSLLLFNNEKSVSFFKNSLFKYNSSLPV